MDALLDEISAEIPEHTRNELLATAFNGPGRFFSSPRSMTPWSTRSQPVGRLCQRPKCISGIVAGLRREG